MLLASDLSQSYGDRTVLAHVDLAVDPGHRVGLVGENGVGKSTLLRLIAGVEDGGKQVFSVTQAGKVWLDENRAAVDGVRQRMALAARRVSGERTPEVVHEAMLTLKQAVIMKPGGWTDVETAKVVEALMKAVKDISEA